MAASTAASVDRDEIDRFAAMADEWWDPHGKFRPLHKLNPARLAYIRDQIAERFARDPLAPAPLTGLRLLDIGCGGGLICEPMTRLGAAVTGIDPGTATVAAARLHAGSMGLDIDYREAAAEDLAAAGERFDVVLNLEVVEHVADVGLFLGASAQLVAPGGCMIVATLNRTAKAFALAVIGAEYVLGWLPRGTHDWRKFVRPSEVAEALRPHGLEVEAMSGLAYNPLNDRWATTRDLDVNYMVVAGRPAA